MSRVGVLLMAHGTPSSLDEMPEYLTLVRGGRPPSDALLHEMRENYAAIGGRSPLTDITQAQAAALRAALGPGIPVAVGMRNWTPFIKDALAELAAAGVTRVIGIPMAPQFSTLSVQKYIDAAAAALPAGVQFESVESFHLHPLLIDAFAERLRPGLPGKVLFTAHSLPARALANGDPYERECRATAAAVAERVGLESYDFAFQSQGMTGDKWLGPTVEATLDRYAADGVRDVIIHCIGFVCDHVEILWDIDIGFKQYAAGRGITIRRPESLNGSPTFSAALAEVAMRCLA